MDTLEMLQCHQAGAKPIILFLVSLTVTVIRHRGQWYNIEDVNLTNFVIPLRVSNYIIRFGNTEF